MKNILITGGLGFIGVNTALKLSGSGYKCYVLDNFYRKESKDNLSLIKDNKNIVLIEQSISDIEKTERLIKEVNFFAILNLAGQVAMSKSLEDPLTDFNINAFGSLCLLESIKKYSNNTLYLYSSTNKVYGDLGWDKVHSLDSRYESIENKFGYDTEIPINLSTPYGCSKGIADLYAIDYFKSFNVKTCVLRLSTIYGTNQSSTYDQGWIGWFIREALVSKNKSLINVLGNGKQVRDILFVDDLVLLIERLLDHPELFNGSKFNVGGGYENSISIIELIKLLEIKLRKSLIINPKKERVSDQKYYVSNIQRLKDSLSWSPTINIETGIDIFTKYIENTL